MICPGCKQDSLRVLNAYQAGDAAQTRNLKCELCGYLSSSVEFLVARPQQQKHGKGGYALAKKIKAGKIQAPSVTD